VVSMTQPAFDLSKQLTPAFVERFAQPIYIPPLTIKESLELVESRLRACRIEGAKLSNRLHPFPDDFTVALRKDTLSVPRRLVQWAFAAVSRWDDTVSLPFTTRT